MRLNKRIEDILAWGLALLLFVLGFIALDALAETDIFWEILRVLIPVVFVGGVTFTFYQQASKDYEKTGKKTAYLQTLIPVGCCFGVFLILKLLDTYLIVVPALFVGYLLFTLILGLIKIIKNK